MPKERLLQCQQEDRAKGLTEHHLTQLKVHFTQCKRTDTVPPFERIVSSNCKAGAAAATAWVVAVMSLLLQQARVKNVRQLLAWQQLLGSHKQHVYEAL